MFKVSSKAIKRQSLVDKSNELALFGINESSSRCKYDHAKKHF